ncbi:MAG: type I-F CRISPR-associated helicase Cas3f [Endozoicomonas sp.]|uniref:type I-F CRISPR-associated helicase Cas3f n=1 Tax=Endozoicomonas sp. TaxID=1892382 RepID=UPI003D9AD8F5
MMVTFISQCEKKALKKTRRVLDAFADRIGTNTWQVLITQEGLNAVRKQLRKTASKSTAVSCHWIRSRSRTELVWVVGNRSRFDQKGRVPVNRTKVNRVRADDRADWHYLPLIQTLTALAALLHDWGKASARFQQKLQPDYKGLAADAIRHEWVSCLLLKRLVQLSGDGSDDSWLECLSRGDLDEEKLKNVDAADRSGALHDLPPAASLVAWLIVSHHRLPRPDISKTTLPDKAESIASLLQYVDESWNYKNQNVSHPLEKCLVFPQGLLTDSDQWLSQIIRWSKKLITLQPLIKQCLEDGSYRVILHHARLALMLGDHNYSNSSDKAWSKTGLKANTQKDQQGRKSTKQNLDQHLLGVCKQAVSNVYNLPAIEREPRGSDDTAELKKTSKQGGFFYWQDQAVSKIKAWKADHTDQRYGFFAVNIASTGKGKTLANAKVMRVLSESGDSLRYILALGLRTLTLQTGDEYRERIFRKSSDDLAVLIGSKAFQELHEGNKKKTEPSDESSLGSESMSPLLQEESQIDYEADRSEAWLTTVLKGSRESAFLHAPVLVCTLDHMMAATETTRGGRYILPCLRLFSSDLVIDEIDDFTGTDSIAIGRLIHLAGMLGRKVMISSATIPPAMAEGYFNAYREGWNLFSKTRTVSNAIGCAWIDEFSTQVISHTRLDKAQSQYAQAHRLFIEKRVQQLKKQPAKRRVVLAEQQPILEKYQDSQGKKLEADRQGAWFKSITTAALDLHRQQAIKDPETKLNVSFGVIRMANIKPCVALTRYLLNHSFPKNVAVRLMAYHSQQVLLLRNAQEQHLDQVLKRKPKKTGVDPALGNEEIRRHLTALARQKVIKHVLFILVATPVEEVGRDHDFDWAVIEPSSYRSLVQMAGRVLRHREHSVDSANIALMQYNWKTLQDGNKPLQPYFSQPGYESKRKISPQNKSACCRTHDVKELVDLKTLDQSLDATPRIQEQPKQRVSRLAQLEHAVIAHDLKNYGAYGPESLQGYLSQSYFLTGLSQAFNPFRNSAPTKVVYLAVSEEQGTFFVEKDEKGSVDKRVNGDFINQEQNPANEYRIERFELSDEEKMRLWLFRDYPVLLEERLSEADSNNLTWVSLRYGELRFREPGKYREYGYNDQLGLVEK